jgi:hypothetical protein
VGEESVEWETDLATLTAELNALGRPVTSFVATGERILELVKRARILYKTQDPAEQRRLLDSVLSNCTFDRGSVCPTYKEPFDLFARASETGEWRGSSLMKSWEGAWDAARRRGPDWPRHAGASLRFILIEVLDTVAPVHTLTEIPKQYYRDGKIMRPGQIYWLCVPPNNRTYRRVARRSSLEYSSPSERTTVRRYTWECAILATAAKPHTERPPRSL